MIGTIRKHSSWLWWIIAGLTIASFVYWGVSPGSRYGAQSGNLGTIYGKAVTRDQLMAARADFEIDYWMRNQQFPKSPTFSPAQIDRSTYERLMLGAKAKQLGIHVTDDAVVAEANDFLRSLGRDRQPVPPSAFVDNILTPQGLTAADFKRTISDNLAIQQLVQSFGMPGQLVTPQEAALLYDHDHAEFSAQAVFFSATNYFHEVTPTPAALALFYTNHLAEYRVPDRVQLVYVEFDLTNYLTAAEQKLGKTNIAAQAEAVFAQRGLDAVPGAKTPEEAKAKISEMILRQSAAKAALDQARDFARALFAMDPPKAENLLALARTDGLIAHTTVPFTEADGPQEFPAPAELIKTAFKLSPDSPFGPRPVAGAEAVYVFGLANQYPNQVQPYALVQDRVLQDFKEYEGTLRAQAAGTNFYHQVAGPMAAGKTFVQAALAAGQSPVILKPFSLSSQSIPEAEGHAEAKEVQFVASQTDVGHISQFEPTMDGGFVLFVQSMLPVDEAAKNSELPRFMAQLRRSRMSEAFNRWMLTEENRELANTPVPQELAADKSSSQRSQ